MRILPESTIAASGATDLFIFSHCFHVFYNYKCIQLNNSCILIRAQSIMYTGIYQQLMFGEDPQNGIWRKLLGEKHIK